MPSKLRRVSADSRWPPVIASANARAPPAPMRFSLNRITRSDESAPLFTAAPSDCIAGSPSLLSERLSSRSCGIEAPASAPVTLLAPSSPRLFLLRLSALPRRSTSQPPCRTTRDTAPLRQARHAMVANAKASCTELVALIRPRMSRMLREATAVRNQRASSRSKTPTRSSCRCSSFKIASAATLRRVTGSCASSRPQRSPRSHGDKAERRRFLQHARANAETRSPYPAA